MDGKAGQTARKVKRLDDGGGEEGRSEGSERSETSVGQMAAVGGREGQKDRKDQKGQMAEVGGKAGQEDRKIR